jgi:hypothetical protein
MRLDREAHRWERRPNLGLIQGIESVQARDAFVDVLGHLS